MHRKRAFSLIEISIVVFVIALLIVLAWVFYHHFFYETKVTKAKEQLTQLVKSINIYYAQEGKFPSKIKELVGKLVSKEESNPWGEKIWMDEVYVKTKTPDGKILKVPYRRMTPMVYEEMKRRALREMRYLAFLMYRFYQKNGYWPKTLSQLGKKWEDFLGPWDYPYYIEGDYIKTKSEIGDIIAFNYKSVDVYTIVKEEFQQKAEKIKSALEKYKLKHGFYPESEDKLVEEGYLDKDTLLLKSKKGRISFRNGELLAHFADGTTMGDRVVEEENMEEAPLSYEVEDGYLERLPRDQIRDLALDDQKRLWVAIWGGGVGYKIPQSNKWKFYTKRDGLPSNYVYKIAFEGNGVWIGTFEGLSYLNLENEKIVTYRVEDGLPDNAVTEIVVDFDGNKWCGTWKKGVFVFKNRKVIKRYASEVGIKGPVYKILVDKYGRKWIGSWEGGLLKVDLVGNTEVFDKNMGFPNNHVISLLEKDNQLWCGLWGGGIVVLDLESSSIWKKYTTYLDASFPSNDVEIIVTDYYGNIWVGFGNGKVATLQNEKWVVYQVGDLLLKKWNVTDIVVDFSGNIWIATWGKGLLKYGSFED